MPVPRPALLIGLLLTLTGARPVSAQTPLPAKPFRAGPHQLFYFETGPRRGTPLVLLSGGPGFNSDYFWFGRAFHDLARDRWVVTYDQRGTGRSAPVGPADTVTIADYVADLDALRAALGVERIDLLGHSWGGYLAQAYAATHRDRIAHLILVGSAAPKFSESNISFDLAFPDRDMSTPFARGVATGDSALVAKALGIYVTMIFYDDAKGERWRELGARINNFNLWVQLHLARDLARQDYTPALAGFRFPTLVTTGRYDMNVAPLTAWRIHQAIAGSEFRVFERSSHIPFYEEPEAFTAALREFLSH